MLSQICPKYGELIDKGEGIKPYKAFMKKVDEILELEEYEQPI